MGEQRDEGAAEVRPLSDGPELAAFSQIVGWAFGIAPEESSAWLERGGLEHVRVIFDRGRLVGGLLHIPMGQWFGGSRVPMTGIAGVAVAPEARGRGVARQLMRASLRELATRGIALSALYPATLPLYRSVGYELGGGRFSAKIRPAEIRVEQSRLELREVTDADDAAVRSAYGKLARWSGGHLDRGDYIWNRVRKPRDGASRGWVVEGEDGVDGYLYVRQKPTNGAHYELHVSDVAAVTADAGRALLAFLGAHHTLGDLVIWHGSPAETLVTLLRERGCSVALVDHWMTRVVDVEAALQSRGYPLGLRAQLELDVADDLLESCRGRFTLTIEEGVGRVRSGGAGALRLDVRGLAGLYTGFSSPFALRRQGLLAGDDEALATAAAVFAGPAPSMPDMF